MALALASRQGSRKHLRLERFLKEADKVDGGTGKCAVRGDVGLKSTAADMTKLLVSAACGSQLPPYLPTSTLSQ